MPGQPVPFRWISELPPKAQKEIERDFEALRVQITQGVAIFDAKIDPAHTRGALTQALAGAPPRRGRHKNIPL